VKVDWREMWLIFGQNGWIGQKLGALLQAQGQPFTYAKSRLENREDIARELDEVKPVFVLNAAGLTGRPNVDWCETHKIETIRVNVIGTLNLADLCELRGIQLTVFATGCIFEYDAAHPIGSGIGFKEEDKPNFCASFYSETKGYVDQLLKNYKHALTLRVRMPLSDEYEHPRSFITKITHYKRVVNVPNSMTELDEMLPIAVDMTAKRVCGIYNFCNPGVISHNEILDMYRKYIHPDFKYENFSLEEQAKILAAGRSNNELDCSKLKALYPQLHSIHDAVENLFMRMKARVPADAQAPIPGVTPVPVVPAQHA